MVTGGARGIGLAIAQRLCQQGMRVLIADVDAQALEAAQSALATSTQNRVSMLCCDVSTATGVQLLAAHIEQEFSGLDVLVNNAAILDSTPIADLTAARLLEVLRVNLLGAVGCCQALLPQLTASAYPRIVNISSINGLRGTAPSVAYNASKAALISLTQSLAVELAPNRIGVNAVAPGFVDTRMSKLPDGSSEYDTQWFRDIYLKHRRILLQRPATPMDIAGPVAFLCSEDARYINGQVLIVDGGVTATF